jgi:hypothetical protein
LEFGVKARRSGEDSREGCGLLEFPEQVEDGTQVHVGQRLRGVVRVTEYPGGQPGAHRGIGHGEADAGTMAVAMGPLVATVSGIRATTCQ